MDFRYDPRLGCVSLALDFARCAPQPVGVGAVTQHVFVPFAFQSQRPALWSWINQPAAAAAAPAGTHRGDDRVLAGLPPLPSQGVEAAPAYLPSLSATVDAMLAMALPDLVRYISSPPVPLA
jgi:hypothetical protein